MRRWMPGFRCACTTCPSRTKREGTAFVPRVTSYNRVQEDKAQAKSFTAVVLPKLQPMVSSANAQNLGAAY